jgi:hypothetical protein
MGNRQCEECQEIKNSNTAYGEFEVCHLEGKQLAIIEKKLELAPGLTERVEKELTKRTKITCKHIGNPLNTQSGFTDSTSCPRSTT